MVADAMCWLASDSVLRMANANATAPRKPARQTNKQKRVRRGPAESMTRWQTLGPEGSSTGTQLSVYLQPDPSEWQPPDLSTAYTGRTYFCKGIFYHSDNCPSIKWHIYNYID